MIDKFECKDEKFSYNIFGDILQDGELFAYSASEKNAKTICNKLNEQDEEIKRLKKTS